VFYITHFAGCMLFYIARVQGFNDQTWVGVNRALIYDSGGQAGRCVPLPLADLCSCLVFIDVCLPACLSVRGFPSACPAACLCVCLTVCQSV
jgi:hypothetical protein